MSARKYTLTLTHRARLDFQDILSHTLQMWGDRQLAEYKGLLDGALTLIQNTPETGQNDLPPYRYVRAGKHYIFYRIDGDTISVSRILHGSMDFIRHLQ